MEIFQKIWMILTTENESLTNIIASPLIFIEVYLYMLLFTTLLNIKYSKKQAVEYVLSFGAIAIINILFVPYPYYTFVNVFACPILVFIVFKLNILNSILCEITVYLASILIATPLVLIYTAITKMSSSLVTSIPLHRIIYSILFYLLCFLVYKIFSKFKINISMLEKLKNKVNLPLLLNFIIGTIAIAIQCYLEFIYIDYLPLYLVIISIFILIIYFLTSLFSLARTTKLETTTQDLEAEKLYNHTLTLLYDKIRGFRHNYNNTVQGIGGYIATNDMEGLKDYYEDVLEECQNANNLALLSPEVINNPAIYSLLTSKYHKALSLNIKMNLEIFMDLSNINMKIYELTNILGILIDNAIEAADKCDEKEITVTIRKDNKRDKQLFIVENTYSNKDVDIDEIFEKGKTSKTNSDAKNHGLGLWQVRQLVKKNRNLDLYTTKSEKYFKQQFEIYC